MAGFEVDMDVVFDRDHAASKTVAWHAVQVMTCVVGWAATRRGGSRGGIATTASLATQLPTDGEAAESSDQ